MAELSSEQLKVSRIAESFSEPPVNSPYLARLARGLQERFGIGRYITQPDIKGGVGDVLTVRLGRVALNDYLPPDLEFRGYRHVANNGEENSRNFSSTSWHFYDVVKRQIGLAVECEPDAPYRLPIQSTPTAGLVVLHEMGHSWDDYDNPQNRALKIKSAFPVVFLQSVTDEQIGQWYQRAYSDSAQGGRIDSELMRKLLKLEVIAQARRMSHELITKDGGIGRLVRPKEFMELAEDLGQVVAQQILVREGTLNRQGLVWSVQTAKKLHDHQYQQFLREYVRKSEAKAWIWAGEMSERLKKLDPKVSLWDGNEKSLRLLKAYFILHHPEVKFDDVPDGEIKELLRGITSVNKIYR